MTMHSDNHISTRSRKTSEGSLVLHEDTFYEYFKPYRHPKSNHNIWGGNGIETFGADFSLLQTLPAENVWTVIDGENSDQWISPGIHHVNRICYLVTKIPHNWLEVEFKVPQRLSSLTRIGLLRQINKLKKRTSGN